ncbi:MAG: hypothetical protein KF768_08605 [Phycisphaeraceae bacterium]|nr:hypothetical protein [Phycisphaeraceae bacterium]
MNRLDLAYLPLVALTAPVWARKTRDNWPGRFGRLPRLPDPPGDATTGGPKPRILLHAVSVGEVSALRGLVPRLRPHADVVVSVGTDTGIARARALFADARNPEACIGPERIVRYPLDFSSAVNRFLDAVRPDAVGLVELELWPNFVAECARREIPVAVINGRLSARSFKGYARLRRFFRRSFGRLSFAAVQDADYAGRFRAMGVPDDRVLITGSMKWDAVKPRGPGEEVPGAAALARAFGLSQIGNDARPLIVAGSTGPLRDSGTPFSSEEALLHTSTPPNASLLCAPRKPERFDEAFAALGGEGACIRRTRADATDAEHARAEPVARFLLDTIGELRAAYALATLVVMGRSFGGLHGSDPIEPIAMGVPTIIGPHHSDFAQIVSAFKAATAIEVVEASALAETLKRLLNDPDRRAELVTNGRACILANQGATERHAHLLLKLAQRQAVI